MDLSNVRAKLHTQNFAHYQTFNEFVADCRLIFDNCAIFNEVSILNIFLEIIVKLLTLAKKKKKKKTFYFAKNLTSGNVSEDTFTF